MKRILVILAVLLTTAIAVKAQSDTKRAFEKSLNAYFETKNALAKDNGTEAVVGANNLINSFTKFPTKGLSETQKAELSSQKTVIEKFAALIVSEKDLKLQRKSFGDVSSAMLKLTKALNLNTQTVYVQYCPMAKKSWLNEVEAVQNPYYGSKMYDCGDVSETIAKK